MTKLTLPGRASPPRASRANLLADGAARYDLAIRAQHQL